MKATAVLIILFVIAIVMPGHAQKSKFVEEEACMSASHFHRHSDLRVAFVEIRDIDRCGFTYVDLEEQTTGLDHRMEFASDFAVAREKVSEDDPSVLRNVMRSRSSIKEGFRGTLMYCLPCRVAFVLKLTSDSGR